MVIRGPHSPRDIVIFFLLPSRSCGGEVFGSSCSVCSCLGVHSTALVSIGGAGVGSMGSGGGGWMGGRVKRTVGGAVLSSLPTVTIPAVFRACRDVREAGIGSQLLMRVGATGQGIHH